jgi:threonyl-tRNA synthetase
MEKDDASAKVTLREVLADAMARDKTIVGGKVDGKIRDIHTPFLRTPTTVIEPIRSSDAFGLRVLRHSAAHVMAEAVQRIFPGTKVTIGPATDAGFYYDFAKPAGTFTEDDLVKIEAAMVEIIAEKRPFRRTVVTREEAQALFAGMSETYKTQIIDSIPQGEEISLYHTGEGSTWVDVCEGPHVPTTASIGAVKLISVAGAYWRGDERNAMLQRIYGTAFPSQKALEAHMKLIAEAKERDHRKLGKELELFMFHEYAPAMPFFLPRGAFVYNGLQSFVRELYTVHGYEEVVTPQIFDKKLFETSGHLPNYRENMYLPVTAEHLDELRLALREGVAPESEGAESYRTADQARDKAVIQKLQELERLGQKPMNCPSHCLIFAHRNRSYRELPWRVADFGRLHRYERGGVVHGLARVRSFCQDDAHIFCTPDQLTSELTAFLHLFYGVYAAFKFTKIEIKLATRPEKRIGSDEQWDASEKALADALQANNLAYEVTPGEGAFYGPKLEFHIEDALKRSWQLGTLQLDYTLPDRFDLEFTGPDGNKHRPIMLHRAILGSLERFFAIYLEHCAGAFPAWLAPEQAVIITVGEGQNEYAQRVVAHLKSKGLRARADLSHEKLGSKKRDARNLRVPYILAVGDREAQEGKVAPWSRDTKADLGPMPLEQFTELLVAEAMVPRILPKDA